MADEQVVSEIWVRHLPTGTLSPIGELYLEQYQNDENYEVLEAPPAEVLATAWEIYYDPANPDDGPGWYVRAHGSEANPDYGPYETEGSATGALKRSQGSDVAFVVTPAAETEPEPPADPPE